MAAIEELGYQLTGEDYHIMNMALLKRLGIPCSKTQEEILRYGTNKQKIKILYNILKDIYISDPEKDTVVEDCFQNRIINTEEHLRKTKHKLKYKK